MGEANTTRVIMIISAILTIILGFLFLANPFGAGETTAIFLGAFLLVDGVIFIVQYFVTKGHETGKSGSLVAGVLMVLLGVFAFMNTGIMMDMIALIVSIFMLMAGIMSFDYSFQMRKAGVGGWVINLILAIIIIIGSICMLVNPFDAIETTFLFIGMVLLMDGIFEIFTAVQIGKI